MIPLFKGGKPDATIILAMKKKDSSLEEGSSKKPTDVLHDVDPGKRAAMEDFLKAFEAKDVNGMVSSLTSFNILCDDYENSMEESSEDAAPTKA